MSERIPILYLAPWVGFGGSDKNTIDWFRWIDQERFAPSLITTQPSSNDLVGEVEPFAEEVWILPELMPAEKMPGFILDFVRSRRIEVIHLMNSRLGFDLLPDLACVPDAPGIVVQLHVEETDRSGYVRYVTTRYGNLVDRFSISNRHVAEAVEGYGIPPNKIEVIYTGVDAEEEFNPARATPVEAMPDDRLDVLFAARLVDQKDPLLMVDVAAGLRDRGIDARFHVVGDGELKPQVEARAAAAGLGDGIAFHPPTPGLQSWYAASDALLLTSTFEGVPCVVFEAMAMGLPIVAPELPGIREMLDAENDGLVADRAVAAEYVERLARLAEDRAYREAQGADLRARAQRQFSVRQMAAAHEQIYADLVASRPPRAAAPATAPSREEPIRFPDRPPADSQPLVSVVVPHYDQGAFLLECIESLRAQTYPNLEIVVVDDASSEARTAAALAELEAAEDVDLVRMEENAGPSHARNVAIKRTKGRYVLPVDADNKLLPDAVERLVAQLSAAGEEIGFVYPNLQYFGNREDYYEVPDYNLFTLLYGNFCDTCSLIDRDVFDAGLFYPEDIKLGHEDWEFVLRLASRGIRGEAAEGPTVLYRKWGFNRSDLVDHAPNDFRDDVLAEISPFRGREAEIKAQEAPALSLLALRPAEDVPDLAADLHDQRCVDMELLVPYEGEWPGDSSFPPVRRLTAGAEPVELLRTGLETAHGAFVALTAGDGAELLRDPAFAARILRRFDAAGDDLDGLALHDLGERGLFTFRAIGEEEEVDPASLHTVIWRRRFEGALPQGLHADPGDPLGSVLHLLVGGGAQIEWRHTAAPASVRTASAAGEWVPLPEDPANEDDPLGLRPAAQPLLPGSGEYRVPRWELTPTWVPPLSTIAVRYREEAGERRIVTNGAAPVGFVAEHHLGAMRSVGFEGTARIVRVGDDYVSVPRGEWHSAPEDAVDIGYAEMARLPEMDVLVLAVHRETGERTLVTMPEDPLLPFVDVIEDLGCLDPFPLRPRETPPAQRAPGTIGLVKTVDAEGRRHRYGLGRVPEGEILGELGGLADSGLAGSIAAWIVDDCLVTERYRPPDLRPNPLSAIRWAAEPAVWRGIATGPARAKVMARRSAAGLKGQTRAPSEELAPSGEPEAWLFDSGRPGLSPLFAAHHPVTGDQLLVRSREDAAHMGYSDPQLLGYVRLIAPVTGDLEHRNLVVPWARRFGAVPQS